MKSYEKELLTRLKSRENHLDSEPLKNVKNALGSVSYVKGNPMTKTEVSLNVAINFFQNQQQITAAALPANLRTRFPVPIFGLTDFYAGFPKFNNILPLEGQWINNLNYSYHEGPELVDQSFVTGWSNVAYWDVIPANFGFAPGSINVATGAVANLVKNNFNWIPGHLYKVSYGTLNQANGSFVNYIFDGITINQATPPFVESASDNSRTSFEAKSFYFIPSATDLIIRATNPALLAMGIYGLSIREVLGDVSYPSDNSIGIFGYNKSFCLSPNVQKGDLIVTYNFIDRAAFNILGDPAIDLYTAEIVVHSDSVAFGTFLNSFVSDLITINTIRYIVPIVNIAQFINPLKFGYQNLFGKTDTDTIDPRNYITNKDFQQQIADIPINLPIDKQLMLGTYIDFNVPGFDMILFVEKVEPLTHK